MQLAINLTARTPLSFRSGRSTDRSETLPYILGSSLVGALAAAHQRLRQNPDEFAELFLQNRLRMGNGYPANFVEDEALQGHQQPVLPIPHTARSCKRFKGFKFQDKSHLDRKAGVTDALIPLALFSLSGENEYTLLESLEEHPATQHPLDAISGFFRHGLSPEHIGQPETPVGLRTRTGINYQTGTASSSVLYSRQILLEGAEFWSSFTIDDDLWDVLNTFFEHLGDSGLRVGNNRTRGFGHVRLEAERVAEEDVAALQQRVDAFSEQFKRAARDAMLDAPAALYIPLLCTSDVIFSDPLLRSRLCVQGEDLEAFGVPGAKLVFHAASTHHIQGWSTLWGLPKADVWAIGMGSVFLFAIEAVTSSTYEGLWRVQHQGLGHRQTEGFGRVSVANRFHLELAGGQFR